MRKFLFDMLGFMCAILLVGGAGVIILGACFLGMTVNLCWFFAALLMAPWMVACARGIEYCVERGRL